MKTGRDNVGMGLLVSRAIGMEGAPPRSAARGLAVAYGLAWAAGRALPPLHRRGVDPAIGRFDVWFRVPPRGALIR